MNLEDLKWKKLYAWRYLSKLWIYRNRLNHDRICIDITFNCNLKCFNCNRSCRQAPSADHMSPGQIEHFLRESMARERRWTHIMIEGGEPTSHSQFPEIVDMILEYKRSFSPATQVILSTNGYGQEVNRRLEKVSQDVILYNSRKTSPVRTEFDAFNVAPVDNEKYKNTDFSRACHIATFWGTGLTRYGYYPCSVGGGIDRVFGFDVGRKELPSHGDPMTQELERLCRVCGHFIRFNRVRRVDQISASWIDAYRAYGENPPVLELYAESGQ
jgi:hypothetical protein